MIQVSEATAASIRRENLLKWMRNLEVNRRSTTRIKLDAEAYGERIYGHFDHLDLCRNDLIHLEKEGHVERFQYLNQAITWSMV